MNFRVYFYMRIVLGLVLLAGSCNVLPRFMESFTLEPLDELGAVDQVKILPTHGSNSKIIKTIDDPKEVDLIVKTFKNYSHDWHNYSPATPPAPILIDFYHKGELQFVVAIGYTDQTTPNKNTIYYLSLPPFRSPGRPLTKQEFNELIQVLGIEENWAYGG